MCPAVECVGVAPDPLLAADDGGNSDYNRVGDFKMPTLVVAGIQEVAIRVKLNRMYIDSDEDAVNGCPVRAEAACNPHGTLGEGVGGRAGRPHVVDPLARFVAGNAETPAGAFRCKRILQTRLNPALILGPVRGVI